MYMCLYIYTYTSLECMCILIFLTVYLLKGFLKALQHSPGKHYIYFLKVNYLLLCKLFLFLWSLL